MVHQNTPEWETTWDKEYANNNMYLLYTLPYVKKDIKSFIHSLLTTQREEMIQKIEGIMKEEKKRQLGLIKNSIHQNDKNMSTYAVGVIANLESSLSDVVSELKDGKN